MKKTIVILLLSILTIAPYFRAYMPLMRESLWDQQLVAISVTTPVSK